MLDYASNIERHKLQDDIFEPTIKTYKAKTSSTIEATCPYCDFSNDFAARDNPQKLGIDNQGYFLDLAGNRILLSVDTNGNNSLYARASWPPLQWFCPVNTKQRQT